MAASVRTSPDLALGQVAKLFDGSAPTTGRSPTPFDVSPIDGRFLFAKAIAQQPGGPTQVSVVLNWLDELKALAPGR
jgi:hypothetical protein